MSTLIVIPARYGSTRLTGKPLHPIAGRLLLERVAGVAMAAALNRSIPIVEYSPKTVKMSVTGSGSASKEQVAYMLESILKQKLEAQYLDATDAVAIAICHHYHANALPSAASKKKGAKKNQKMRFE